ncbi:hypothetical protein GSI_14355 [Ganoderma sinense ZZ0214-1]|uniref:DUF6699 domain-containing protein n=1 Tax=Ganoderma sinense ZZ0214-1 TaxID=1077348 RepID=A0A2G8RNY5_9APHY|nr:hypothetical protein GSI_14355 [Ganoderma sinense ZZ0214-1]
MSFDQDQVPKRVRFVDDPEVHSYTPDTSPGSASSDELRTPSDNGTLPLPSMANYIAQCTTWAPGFVPSTVLVPPGYMLVAPPAPPAAPASYRVPALGPTPVPAIHHALVRPPFQWDVRAALPPTDLPYRSEPAFSTHAASITLRFADVAYPIVSAAGGRAALRVVDVLRAVHDALYTRVQGPLRDAAARRAAEVAQGYRALKRDGNGGGLLRVDMYPVSPNRVGGARLLFVGLEWGEGRGEVRVLLGPGA